MKRKLLLLFLLFITMIFIGGNESKKFHVRKSNVDGEDVLIANLIITDPEAISEIESGAKNELSCGYDCDILGKY